MSIKITITESEILDTPNDFDLGEKIRKMYFTEKSSKESKEDDSKYIIITDETGLTKGIHISDYMEIKHDKCSICWKTSNYTKNTHIDLRIGYVEGVGQTCFQPEVCNVY